VAREKIANAGDAFRQLRVGGREIVVSADEVKGPDGEVGAHFALGNALDGHEAIAGSRPRKAVAGEEPGERDADGENDRGECEAIDSHSDEAKSWRIVRK